MAQEEPCEAPVGHATRDLGVEVARPLPQPGLDDQRELTVGGRVVLGQQLLRAAVHVGDLDRPSVVPEEVDLAVREHGLDEEGRVHGDVAALTGALLEDERELAGPVALARLGGNLGAGRAYGGASAGGRSSGVVTWAHAHLRRGLRARSGRPSDGVVPQKGYLGVLFTDLSPDLAVLTRVRPGRLSLAREPAQPYWEGVCGRSRGVVGGEVAGLSGLSAGGPGRGL